MRRCQAALLALCLTVTGFVLVPAEARAQSSDSATDLEQQIIALKEVLDGETRRQAELSERLAEIDAEIDVSTAEEHDMQRAVAAAESAVKSSSQRVDMMAKELYRHPSQRLASILNAGSPNDYIVGQRYLGQALHQNSDALDANVRDRDDLARLTQELHDKRRALEDEQAQREASKKIVDASVANQQAAIAKLEGVLATARSQGALPWGGFPNCTAAPHTNLPGPWTLEDWAAATLKSLALRMGRPVTEVLTHEHIVALIAFAWGEGGGTNNHKGQFNPLNTNGWTRLFPELQGRSSGFGTDDWPTFDAGVEATARALTWRTQNRTAKTLLIPTSTARDFFVALQSAGAYAGNKNWSADDAAQNGKYNSILGSIAANYGKYAGTVLQASGQVPTPGTPRVPTGVGPAGFADLPMGC